MKILVLNSGSSSLKFQLFDMPSGVVICSGQVDRIGEEKGSITYNKGAEKYFDEDEFRDHHKALKYVSNLLTSNQRGAIKSNTEINAVGHRVVHGGEDFKKTIFIDEQVKQKIKQLFSLAPLHNPPNLQGIEVAEAVFPSAKQIAVFDTAFHSSLPEMAYRFAIPNKLYENHSIRVYGFHGTSHLYVSRAAIRYMKLENQKSKIVTIHLGNGCSIAAIRDGESIDTSMGFGPLSGLVMGTRSGDMDPSIIFYLEEKGHDMKEIKGILNKQSGLGGLADENDMRLVNAMARSGNKKAQLALDIYAYRIKKYIGAYAAALNGLDAIVFTAGVGENDGDTRARVCADMEYLGISLAFEKNAQSGSDIQEIQSGSTKILVIPTNEELEIANQCITLLQN